MDSDGGSEGETEQESDIIKNSETIISISPKANSSVANN
jgi:hypothetical protein